MLDEQKIRHMFRQNWVFRIYNIGMREPRFTYLVSAALISGVLFLVGALGALLFGALPAYLNSVSPYLHLAGIFLVFFSFDWFIKRMIRILVQIEDAFEATAKSYRDAIQKMVDAIASRNIYMALVGAVFAILNIVEINAIWNAPTPPILMANWITSPAQVYFRVFYTLIHGLVVPFLLGSGVIGLIGYIGLIHKLFQFPLKLKYYQTTSLVIEWTTGLVMWTLMALGLILTLARPIVFFRTNIREILLSGGVQAIIALILALLVGIIPLRAVYGAIAKAKKEELRDWNHLRNELANELKTHLTKKYSAVRQNKDLLDKKLERINRDIVSVDTEMRRINDIPSLPIKWPSILRVGIGTVFSVAMPLVKDFLLEKVHI